MEWHAFKGLDEYEKLVIRMNNPRVVIDNAVCPFSTIVKVDSGSKHRILLEAVQVLTDLNLSIKKAYISSDGRWFMDVFHVTDLHGNKLTDESVISYIQQSLGDVQFKTSKTFGGLTALELTGADRVGLVSEVFAVLADLECNVMEAKLWTHNGRIASLIYVSDVNSGSSIDDSRKINGIEARLRQIVKGDIEIRSARTSAYTPVLHVDRTLHQMMFADRDYEHELPSKQTTDSHIVSLQNWTERSYSVINIHCSDRTNLLFDVVCTLTDMEYAVFHATMKTSDERAYMEFYIRHSDGTPINSESEMERVCLCIHAAIERRASEGMRLELCAEDRHGLLADVTRIFRENGLNLTKAEISTTENAALNIFHVTDAVGAAPDSKLIESIRQTIGSECLRVKELPKMHHQNQSMGVGGPFRVSLGSLVKKNLYNLGLIRSYSQKNKVTFS